MQNQPNQPRRRRAQRGHIVKRGKTWTAIYDVAPKVVVDENGEQKEERVQRWKGGFATKSAAQEWLNDVLGKLQNGTYSEPSSERFSTYLEGTWLPAIRGTIAALSYAKYQQIVEGHIKPRSLGDLPLSHISGGSINRWLGELETAKLGPASRRLAFAVISRSLRDAVKWKLIPQSPARDADPPKRPKSGARVRVFTRNELVRFLDAVGDDRLAVCYRLAAMTGMRRGELLGLRWYDCDLEGRKLTISQTLIPAPRKRAEGTPGWLISDAKTDGSARTISLDAATVDALREHQERQKLERALYGDDYQDHDLVFANESGSPVYPSRLTAGFTQHARKAGLPPISLHGLRHTHASLLLLDRVSPNIVAERLGHTDVSTTLRTYGHLIAGSDAQAADRFADLLAGD